MGFPSPPDLWVLVGFMMAIDKKIVDFASVHFVFMKILTSSSHVFFLNIRIPFGWISGRVGVCHVGHPTETPKEP
jgi:hypothetical protein